MYPTYNKTPYYQLIHSLCYFSSKITFTGYLLLYAFFCTILTHSVLLDLFPSMVGILNFSRYFITLTYFAGALLYIIIYKDFNIYIDRTYAAGPDPLFYTTI